MARRKKKSVSRTLVGLLVDKSYSMMERREETIDACNEYINGLKAEGEGEMIATMIQFDSPPYGDFYEGATFEETYVNTPIKDVPKLGSHNYLPRGNTPLYDAIAHIIGRIEEEDNGKDDKVVIVIQTDGLENRSRHHNKYSIRELRDKKEAEGWEFIFLGTGEQAWSAGHGLGFRSSQTVNYGTKDKQDHKDAVYLAASASAVASRSVRGSHAHESFLMASPEKARLEGKAKGKTTSKRQPRTKTT